MDIAKIRKKAKEREEGKAQAAEQRKAPPGAVPEELGAVEEEPRLEHEPAPHPAGAEGSPQEYEAPGVSDTRGVEETTPPPPAKEAVARDFSGGEEPVEESLLELLTFSLSSEEFAFRVPEVEEIIRYQRITKVPTMPAYVRGITSLRGKVIPVIDLKARLAMKDSGEIAEDDGEMDGNMKILILAGPKGLIGATIDKVLGVVRFPGGSVLDPPAHLSEEELKYLEGVVISEKRFISIIRSYDALDIEFT